MVVHRNQADPGGDRLPQLLLALVVTVERHGRGGYAGPESREELTAGDDVETEALLVEDPEDGDREKRFAGVHHTRAGTDALKCLLHGTRPAAQRFLIEDVERRPVPIGQLA